MWGYIIISPQLNTLENELKSSPTDTTSVGRFFFLYFPLQPPSLTFWLPVDNACAMRKVVPEPSLIVLQVKKATPAQNTRPWHYPNTAPGPSGCHYFTGFYVYWFHLKETVKAKGASGGREKRTLLPRCSIAQHKRQYQIQYLSAAFTHPTNTSTCPVCQTLFSHWGCSKYKFYIPHSLLPVSNAHCVLGWPKVCLGFLCNVTEETWTCNLIPSMGQAHIKVDKARASLMVQWLNLPADANGFNPDLGRSRATEKLSPCATTTKPVLQRHQELNCWAHPTTNYWSPALESLLCNKESLPSKEKPGHPRTRRKKPAQPY